MALGIRHWALGKANTNHVRDLQKSTKVVTLNLFQGLYENIYY